MDNSLSNKLSLYFDHLLGDTTATAETTILKTKEIKRKKVAESKTICNDRMETESDDLSHPKRKKKRKRDVVHDTDEIKTMKSNTTLDSDGKPDAVTVKQSSRSRKNKENRNETKKKSKKIHDAHTACRKKTAPAENITEDGFKIVSTIPEDDSDVSDAFECDADEFDKQPTMNQSQEYQKKQAGSTTKEPRKTEDGFKLVNEIPPDDSDFSDAFSEDDYVDTEQDFLTDAPQGQVQKTIKKPILQMIDDFGIDSSILLGKQSQDISNVCQSKKRNSNSGNTNTLTHAAKKKQQEAVVILDYTNKRGLGKKVEPKDENISQLHEVSSQEIVDEKAEKRMRYDVFKFGMNGFHRKKKEDARVSLAIKLGAKPPKNKAVNYKILMAMKKEEKEKEIQEREMKQKMGIRLTKKLPKKKPRGKRKMRGLNSQIGRYEDGVQVLSRKDLARIKS